MPIQPSDWPFRDIPIAHRRLSSEWTRSFAPAKLTRASVVWLTSLKDLTAIIMIVERDRRFVRSFGPGFYSKIAGRSVGRSALIIVGKRVSRYSLSFFRFSLRPTPSGYIFACLSPCFRGYLSVYRITIGSVPAHDPWQFSSMPPDRRLRTLSRARPTNERADEQSVHLTDCTDG